MSSARTPVVRKTGFQTIHAGEFLRPSTITKGRLLCESGHVFDVSEETNGTRCVVTAKCIRQASVNKEAYTVMVEVDDKRHVKTAHCKCKAGITGTCKHTAAVITFVNNEDSSSQTSKENKWKKPSAKQLGMYNKGVPLRKMYPLEGGVKSVHQCPIPPQLMLVTCPMTIMIRAQQRQDRNAQRLKAALLNIHDPSPLFSSSVDVMDSSFPEHFTQIMVDEETCNSIAMDTVMQSMCTTWFSERHTRLSAGTKAHHIKIRKSDFESLAKQLIHAKPFFSSACAYGVRMEPIAGECYEKLTNCEVLQAGVIISTAEPWLCCSPDGLICDGDRPVRLLEIKSPERCCKRGVIDSNGAIAVDYLENRDGKPFLKETHAYYTQIQVSLYALNLSVWDLFVYSPVKSVLITVEKDESFLRDVIPKMEMFFFKHYLPALVV